ncbi:uncharacterized protein HMPREF1541_09707 [Cyphellophora europaea CBS 101466]|uniref:Uncharacterized protein n=1 Tax=Cyphellophora europaea (strain CBS 101466) TaxID=1220924 RepID=W2S830_CYPE1|nr:uncharacterized protein HMPREF1541_09707 [Cyphellophora europaea CBS 101466]ETN44832.1 hypothetical protein HMPREF1541_09707 [Cyphellophora europaea CBS 101466]
MRTIWARATRPRASFNPAPRLSVNSLLARRSVAASASRTQIAACDVFALFLGPLLAAAAFADVSWKDKKRKEWESRFAKINQDLELLRAREVELWTRIQYRSVRNGVGQHRRMYSTAAATVVPDQPILNDWMDDSSSNHIELVEDALPPADSSPISPHDRDSSGSEISYPELPLDSSSLHYERLLALRLALQLILQVYTGSNELYPESNRTFIEDNALPEDFGKVVVRLHAVTRELIELDRRRDLAKDGIPFRHTPRPEDRANQRRDIIALGSLFRDGSITTSGLVDRVTQWLLQEGQTPPGPVLYAKLVMLFSFNNLPELARHALQALTNTTYAIDEREICSMLEHSSNLRDVKTFDWVIHQLTSANGVLVSGGQRWEWWRVSGVLLPVPSNQSARLLRALIRCALNFGDPQRAEAYATLESISKDPYMMGFALKAFLQYYARAKDWQLGRKWLRKTYEWIDRWNLEGRTGPNGLSAVLLRIFDLLVACDQRDDQWTLLEAVVAAGVEPPRLDASKGESTARVEFIVRQWQGLINENNPDALTSQSYSSLKEFMSTFHIFTQGDAPRSYPDLSLPPQSSLDVDALKEVNERYEAALARMEAQVSESRRLHEELRLAATRTPAVDPIPQSAAVTQADMSKLFELISRERQTHVRMHREQQEAMKEQEMKIQALQEQLRSVTEEAKKNAAAVKTIPSTSDAPPHTSSPPDSSHQSTLEELHNVATAAYASTASTRGSPPMPQGRISLSGKINGFGSPISETADEASHDTDSDSQRDSGYDSDSSSTSTSMSMSPNTRAPSAARAGKRLYSPPARAKQHASSATNPSTAPSDAAEPTVRILRVRAKPDKKDARATPPYRRVWLDSLPTAESELDGVRRDETA